MKTFIIAAASVAALALGTAASAQTTNQDVGHVYGSLGYQSANNNKTGSSLGAVDATVGTKLNPYFGVEGEAAFGTNTDKRGDGDYKLSNKWGAYGVGYLPISSRFDLLGRVGVSDTDMKAPATAGKLEQGTALDYGVGAQYHINPSYALRADVTKSDFEGDKGSATTTSVKLVKSF
ncbi:porin family protein [Asticcacaulis sp. EMRT-3]|uniref:porin family protein n=1 Tax=Asticcacaulis sp. EMRT-3 TaxID=3040349 RepID=UPI0024AEC9CB|nr:porin family protein [Asticcacaulis sp. EMRT-3]MDI7774977.1 porin family protein [Asticcacaulis sp. EMRT-3]